MGPRFSSPGCFCWTEQVAFTRRVAEQPASACNPFPFPCPGATEKSITNQDFR